MALNHLILSLTNREVPMEGHKLQATMDLGLAVGIEVTTELATRVATVLVGVKAWDLEISAITEEEWAETTEIKVLSLIRVAKPTAGIKVRPTITTVIWTAVIQKTTTETRTIDKETKAFLAREIIEMTIAVLLQLQKSSWVALIMGLVRMSSESILNKNSVQSRLHKLLKMPTLDKVKGLALSLSKLKQLLKSLSMRSEWPLLMEEKLI